MKKKIATWICILACMLGIANTTLTRTAHAAFGAEIPFLIKLIAQAIQQVTLLQQALGQAKQTVGLLEEMNRGIKEVLRIAETAHVPIPKQLYDEIKTIDAATQKAREVYGDISPVAPTFAKNGYRSGVEALFLSQDAFEYSKYLDDQANRVKSAAVTANQASATKLTAQTLGVVLHAINHSNRIQAKSLEISSGREMRESAMESGRFESFTNTQSAIETNMRSSRVYPLNSFGELEEGK